MMTNSIKRTLGFLSLCVVNAALAQSTTAVAAAPEESSNKPVAYVYVSYSLNNGAGTNQIAAFAAAQDGKLTRIPGSPFHADVESMAVNGKYLFGANTNGSNIDSFAIAANGALKHVATTDAQKYNGSGCGGLGPLILDHSGATLYSTVSVSGSCEDSEYQSFSVEKPTGGLKYVGSTAVISFFNYPLSFTRNDLFAYGSACIDYQGNYLDTFDGFARASDGMLTSTGAKPPLPTPKLAGDFYCPSLTATDPSNHLAISLQAIDPSTSSVDGPPQLATYTVDAHGNLTTTSTRENMPATAAGNLSNLAMSPSGKLLAVAGDAGLQVFHFHGSQPIAHYTGLLTTDAISQVSSAPNLVFWDNSNHLYAISPVAGKLFVFTVTPASVSQAPGSPYSIPYAQDLIVQPVTAK